MTQRVVGIRYGKAGKLHYFDAAALPTQIGDLVVVETMRGPQVGRVVVTPDQVIANEIEGPLRPILRLATPADRSLSE